MKKLFFSLLLATGLMTVSSAAFAQKDILNDLPPYKLGLVAGMNASSFSHDGYDGKFGFHVGINALFDASELIKDTYVRTELLFQRKGARGALLSSASPVVDSDVRFRTCYLELPVHYGYAYALNSDWTSFGETGPYVALGLGGRIHGEDGLGNKVSSKFFTNEYAGNDDPNNFDLGWGLHLGTIFQQKHELKIGWDWGLINMNDTFEQNRNFMVSYGFYFQ
ncbi:MAG: outer membrane beta-barrel protein [Bacteroidales bacterium]|nr:outer membrane beta-barrel protein [Bacteroidales bacterium]